MRISDLELLLVEVPRTASQPPVRSLLVRLSTDVGIEGWGEAAVGWRAGELAARRDALLPILIGRSVFDVEELARLEALAPVALRAALEIASWDAVGRRCRQPLCHLWGGPYRRRVPLAVRLSPEPADRVPHRARELAEQGFHTQIVATTGRVESDLELVAAVREAGGERLELRLDVAGRLPVAEVRRLAAALAPDRVQFALDPLAECDPRQLAQLAHETRAPLGAGRGITGTSDAFAVAASGGVRHLVIDPYLVGGLAAARKCATICEAAGVGASLAGPPAAGVATAAMLQLAAATPGFASANESAYFELDDDVLADRHLVVDGLLSVPDGAGLGIELSRKKIERYQVG